MSTAQSWSLLSGVLGSLVFVEKKCEQGMAYDLANDYVSVNTSPDAVVVMTTAPLKRINEFHQFFQGRTHILSNRPELTVSMALSLPDFSGTFQVELILIFSSCDFCEREYSQ
jgi:hypothetical protein